MPVLLPLIGERREFASVLHRCDRLDRLARRTALCSWGVDRLESLSSMNARPDIALWTAS
jgi:hypothetical protein